jgi:hypothetical protein
VAERHAVARTALTRLADAGLIESLTLEAYPLLPLLRPLFAWNVGDPCPPPTHWDQIAAQSQNRWNKPHVPVEVWRATKRASHIWGAFHDARRVRHSEASHDLHLAEVFVRYRRERPAAADDWFGEAAFPKLGFDLKRMKDPDAFLMSDSGTAHRVVEFAGSYQAEHLWEFHAHCSGQAAEKIARWFGKISTSSRGGTRRLARLYATGGTGYELW